MDYKKIIFINSEFLLIHGLLENLANCRVGKDEPSFWKQFFLFCFHLLITYSMEVVCVVVKHKDSERRYLG